MKLKVPNKYEKVFDRLEEDGDLIDDCKYMLSFKEGYAWMGEYWAVPVKSKKEALQFIREYDVDHTIKVEGSDIRTPII